jgi:hypothetical protein
MTDQSAATNDQVVAVDIRENKVYVTVADGRVIGSPLDWYPWLAQATPEQRANVEMYILSAYWPDLDDGIDVVEMLKGIPPRVIRAT